MTTALSRNELLREARAHDVRALHVAGKDLSFLPELPDPEHLSLGDVGDVTPAMRRWPGTRPSSSCSSRSPATCRSPG